jgi:uncharacterized protein
MMKILVLGVSVRAMVESAVKSGYSVIALDAFGDRDLATMAECHSLHHDFQLRYDANDLFEASRQLRFDAIAYTANLENHPEILRRFAPKRIIGNSPQTVERVRDWAPLFRNLIQAGFSPPETIFPDYGCAINPERRWLVKPILSGGGHGIDFLNENKLRGSSMVQEYIAGKPCSASFVANGCDCVLLGVSEQLIGLSAFGAQKFRYCGNLLPLREAMDPGGKILEQVRRLAEFLTREYRLTGVVGMDFILKDNLVWPIEVNPRYSASMELIEQAYGLPIFHIHWKAAMEGNLPNFELEALINSGKCYGKAILYADGDVVAPDIPDWDARNIRDVPAPGEMLRSGGPIFTIFAGGPSLDETLSKLIGKAEALKKEIYGSIDSDAYHRAFH